MYNGFHCITVHKNVLFVCLVIKGIIMNWKSRKDFLHIITMEDVLHVSSLNMGERHIEAIESTCSCNASHPS